MNKILKTLIAVAVLPSFGVLPAKSETVSIYDDTFSIVFAGSPITTGILSGRWGIWDNETQTFNQTILNAANRGYLDMPFPELAIEVNQINNDILPATTTAGTGLLALAIFTDGVTSDAQGLNYSPSYRRAVLTDSSWTTPSFNNNAIYVNYVFTANTTAVIGSYSFNGGNEVITLVPEPSTGALMMIGAAGLVALRRLRKV